MKNFQFSIFNFQKRGLPCGAKRSTGFSLVETLVAVGILAVAVIGALSAASSGISLSTLSKDQTIAFYLAQEGVEQVRNIRDENALNGRVWLYGIAENSNDPCYFGETCYVDVINAPFLNRCDSGGCPTLREDPDTGFYGYNLLWPETNFKRTVELTSINSHEISILVTVEWSKGVINKQFRVRENILDWQ